jgi:hypothetical protein
MKEFRDVAFCVDDTWQSLQSLLLRLRISCPVPGTFHWPTSRLQMDVRRLL